MGKTSIVNRFVSDAFSLETISTTSAQFVSKKIEFEKYKKSIKFDIWDTAGQEKYRSLARIFYKDALVVLLVYDITRKSSFEQIEQFWVGQVRDFAPSKAMMVLVANKSDLYNQEEVTDSEGLEFAQTIGAMFKTTSAHSNIGIDTLFERIGTKFIDPSYDYLAEERKAIEEYNQKKEIKLSAEKDNKKKKCCA